MTRLPFNEESLRKPRKHESYMPAILIIGIAAFIASACFKIFCLYLTAQP